MDITLDLAHFFSEEISYCQKDGGMLCSGFMWKLSIQLQSLFNIMKKVGQFLPLDITLVCFQCLKTIN